MLVTTIAGIDQLPIGTKLEAISGKITKVYEFKTGESQHGQWSLQNLVVQDATGSTTVVLKNRAELEKSWQGVTVYFVAGQYKNRPSGVEIDEYKEKRRIVVNEHASLEEGEPQQQTRKQPAPQQRQPAPQTSQTQQRQQPPDLQEEERQEQQNARPQTQQAPARQQGQGQGKPEKTPEERIHDTKKDILRLATLYTFCHDAAVLHSASVHSRHGHSQHPASIGALATTLFIQANMQQIGRSIPAIVPTQLPAPQFKMRDIIDEWERHQKELAASGSAVVSDNAPPTQDNLSAMTEKEW